MADTAAPSPAELADYAERARIGDWTLRSALVRYAQLAPVAASAVLELVRRTDGALHPHRRGLETSTPAELDAATHDGPPVVALLEVAAVLDELGDALASWADDRALPEPHDVVRRAGDRAFAMLAELGVPRETRPEGPPRRRSRG